MKIEGGCYCGAIRYEFDGDPILSLQCHCRECQYFTGGEANTIMVLPESNFKYVKGTPKSFSRTDIENAVTRSFCGDCGTALVTQSAAAPGAMITKVGTMDDPSLFTSQMAIFTDDKQSFHHIPEGMTSFGKGMS